MVELEHTRMLLEQMGLNTAAQILDAQLERSLHGQQTYVQFLNELLSCEQQERQRKSADLKKAQLQGRLERRWRVYLRPALLVIDEVGYMQLDRQEAELLFRLISERYEHGSIILTSNKYFSDWGELLSDNVLATALLDRLLHHAHVVNIRGQTYRLRERMKAGVQTVPPTVLPTDS